MYNNNNDNLNNIIITKTNIFSPKEKKSRRRVHPKLFLSCVRSIVFFLAVALTSSALIIERMEGLLDRSWVAGVSPGEILFSHVVTQFVVMCGQTALVLIFMILVFGVECKGDIGWVIILTILQGLCGMCFGKATTSRAVSRVCDTFARDKTSRARKRLHQDCPFDLRARVDKYHAR